MDNQPNSGNDATRAGYAALIGLPNAGKSSLMNRLLDQPLSIVTPVAQTTRSPVVGIDTRDGVQTVYLDTPGLVEPRYLLHQAMLKTALDAVPDVDVVVFVVDAAAPPPELGDEVRERVTSRRAQMLVALNKVDVAAPERLERARRWADELGPAGVFALSATTGDGTEALRTEITRRLPVSPYFFPADEVSSQPVRFFVAEFVRETVIEQYQQEIPHSVFVEIEEYRETATPVFIRATVYVERPTQKQILIGRGGAAIRELGRVARMKIEGFIGASVYLDLWVKVLPKWRKHAPTLRRLGFTLPPAEK